MNTRSESPFPTRQCADCGDNTPRSSGDFCTVCRNVRQLFGHFPSDIESVSVETIRDDHRHKPYGYRVTVNGQSNAAWFRSREQRDFRHREKKAQARRFPSDD